MPGVNAAGAEEIFLFKSPLWFACAKRRQVPYLDVSTEDCNIFIYFLMRLHVHISLPLQNISWDIMCTQFMSTWGLHVLMVEASVFLYLNGFDYRWLISHVKWPDMIIKQFIYSLFHFVHPPIRSSALLFALWWRNCNDTPFHEKINRFQTRVRFIPGRLNAMLTPITLMKYTWQRGKTNRWWAKPRLCICDPGLGSSCLGGLQILPVLVWTWNVCRITIKGVIEDRQSRGKKHFILEPWTYQAWLRQAIKYIRMINTNSVIMFPQQNTKNSLTHLWIQTALSSVNMFTSVSTNLPKGFWLWYLNKNN